MTEGIGFVGCALTSCGAFYLGLPITGGLFLVLSLACLGYGIAK